MRGLGQLYPQSCIEPLDEEMGMWWAWGIWPSGRDRADPLRGCDLVKGVPTGKCTRGKHVYERVCKKYIYVHR